MEIGSREAIREAVIRGLGISYVSEAEFVADPGLRMIAIADAEIYTYAHVVVLKKRYQAAFGLFSMSCARRKHKRAMRQRCIATLYLSNLNARAR